MTVLDLVRDVALGTAGAALYLMGERLGRWVVGCAMCARRRAWPTSLPEVVRRDPVARMCGRCENAYVHEVVRRAVRREDA